VRNAIDAQGKPLGYGVITGEPEALSYVKSGRYKFSADDTVALYTDGFKPYFTLATFPNLLARVTSHNQLQKQIERLVRQHRKKEGWNREKTLMVVRV